MSLRFLIGACVCAVINFGIAVIFYAGHSEMQASPSYSYVLFKPWFGAMWVVLFAIVAASQWYGIARDNAEVVRTATGIGVIAKAIWSFMFAIALFDPRIGTATGMGLWLTFGLLSYELIFLALPNTPRLDQIVKRTKETRKTRTL